MDTARVFAIFSVTMVYFIQTGKLFSPECLFLCEWLVAKLL